MATKFMTTVTGLVMAIQASLFEPSITGVGGSSIYPVFQVWAQKYNAKTGFKVNYQPIGSGGGIHQIETRTVDFANSDKPLSQDELTKNRLVQFPLGIIGIVPVVHLPGVRAGQLVLDGPVLSGIYLGEIKKWNDPAIQALNPGLALQDMDIIPVHRSDGSGTTFNFTNYLGKVNPQWSRSVGADTSVTWPTGAGGKGNDGVAGIVQRINGSIGYVEYAFAKQAHLVWIGMINEGGERVQPSVASFQAAAANADFGQVQDFALTLTNQPRAWPITAATYILMRRDNPAVTNKSILKFLDFALHEGAADAARLDYVSLPDSVVKKVQASWKQTLNITP